MNTPRLTSGNPSPWNVDPDTLVRLRLDRARSELEGGRLGSALVEAEELLGDLVGVVPLVLAHVLAEVNNPPVVQAGPDLPLLVDELPYPLVSRVPIGWRAC